MNQFRPEGPPVERVSSPMTPRPTFAHLGIEVPVPDDRSVPAIRVSELSYRRLFEAARDGILILNVDTGRIEDVNPFLVELLGFTRAEMIGCTVGELSPFKDIESNEAMLQQLQRHGYVRYEHLPLETRAGRRIDVEFVSNVYEAGSRKVIQCNIRDITERKRAEGEILRLHAQVNALNADLERRVFERTAQLEAANEDLEAFSRSVSHDLRAPLRHVLGFVELLHRDVATSLSEKSLRHLTTISESAQRMGHMIDDLLGLSRVGRATLAKSSVDLRELVGETIREMEPDTRGRDLVWDIRSLPVVRADRGLLRLVLANLIGNAVKFTGEKVRAVIEIGTVAGAADETVIYVRDNGAGFDVRYADKLFDVFQRLHSEAEFKGTGVGLSTVRRIVQRHGGRTWAEGVVDQGATFYFSLPA